MESSLAELLGSKPAREEEGRARRGEIDPETGYVYGYSTNMPHLSPEDPDRSRKVAWVNEHVRDTFVEPCGGMRYDAEGIAWAFDTNPGRNLEYDAEFRHEMQRQPPSPSVLMAEADVPAEVMASASSGYVPPAAVAEYGDELSREERPRSAVLVGGDGATVAAAWLIGKRPGARYVYFPELLADLDATPGKKGPEGYKAKGRPLQSPALLVLDGFDLMPVDGQAVEALLPVFRCRHTRGLPTVCTSRRTLEEVERLTVAGARTEAEREQARQMFREMLNSTGRTAEERARHVMRIDAARTARIDGTVGQGAE